MKTDTLKAFIDACQATRTILNSLPDLPPGMSPRHIRILGMIHDLGKEKELVKVSDVASAMHSTRPSITRLVHELEDLDLVTKHQQLDDRRVFALELTLKGKEYYQYYVEDYYNGFAIKLSDFTDQEIQEASRVITQVCDILTKK